MRVEIRSDRNEVVLDEGEFTTQLFELRVDYSFSPDVSWSNLVQYDSASAILGFQSRFRLILEPGNDLFLIFNRGWEDLEGRFIPVFDRGSVKFQYTFRL